VSLFINTTAVFAANFFLCHVRIRVTYLRGCNAVSRITVYQLFFNVGIYDFMAGSLKIY